MALKIRYNSPVVLTFSLICMGVYFGNWAIWGDPTSNKWSMTTQFFTLFPQFNFADPLDYLRLISYTMGHANQGHIAGNMSIFLLIAPIMEEKYGSRNILIMMVTTALVTALFQILLFNTALLGASGLVFMFIVLVSFADVRKGTIPMTFILVVLFFLGKEVIHSMQDNQVSEYGHIMGGIMGAIFGYLFNDKKEDPKPIQKPKAGNEDLLDDVLNAGM